MTGVRYILMVAVSVAVSIKSNAVYECACVGNTPWNSHAGLLASLDKGGPGCIWISNPAQSIRHDRSDRVPSIETFFPSRSSQHLHNRPIGGGERAGAHQL